MSYQAEISRNNPTCFLFLIDQSGSMADSFGGSESSRSKADGVADAINRLLQNLSLRCAKEEGVRDYFYISVIGYGNKVGPAFGGSLTGQELVSISQVAENPIRIEDRIRKMDDGTGGVIESKVKFPIWFESVSNSGTPMCQALSIAHRIIQNWVNQHPDCFPPVVINLTDGEATDGDPVSAAQPLTQLASTDGNILLFNLHLSSTKAPTNTFPDSETLLADDYAKQLFRMSSILPDAMIQAARNEKYQVSETSRGFVFNADLVSVINFLNIGTRPSNLR